MKSPCLPRCFAPVFATCDMPEVPICCIQWTIPCNGTDYVVTYDAGVAVARIGLSGSEYVQQVLDNLCKTSKSGNTTWFYDDLNARVVSCSSIGTDICAHESVTDYPPSGEVEGFPVWHCLPDYLGLEYDGEISITPFLEWNCVGVGPSTKVVFAAGWAFVKPVSGGACICYGILVASGEVPIDWYVGGAPASFTLAPLEDGYPSVVVQPLVCNYLPCGDPLDCFASCISGTEDCDGVTPSHRPVIYFTYITIGCCFAGTHALTFGGPGGYGYHGRVECIDGLGIRHVMEITVNCGATAGADGSGGLGSPAYLHLDFWAYYPDGSVDHVHYDISIPMSCTGGALNEISGDVSETYCGLFSAADWVIHL